MTTRAKQITFILDGLRDPDDDSPLNGGTVEFYEAGTLNAKNVWTEKEKTNAFTSYTLDSFGQAQLYGDGIYKVIVKDSGGATEHTWDDIKIQSTNFNIVTKIGTYTATPDDDVVLCNGTFTLSLQAVANFERPVVIKNIGTGTITVDPDSTETVDGASTVTISRQYEAITLYPDTTANVWRRGYLENISLVDADQDTKIQVEESADEDIIRFDLGDATLSAAAEVLTLQAIDATNVKLEPTTDNIVDLGSATKEFRNAYFDGTVYADELSLNGGALLLDDDADTNIRSSVDDRIDITIATALEYYFTGTAIYPATDGANDLGIQTTNQWANVWSDLINGADYSFLNKWRLLESDKYEGYPKGIAIGCEGFKDGVVTDKMPKKLKPLLAITAEFIEYKGVRITADDLKNILSQLKLNPNSH